MKQRFSAARLFLTMLWGLSLVALPLSLSAQSADYGRVYSVEASAPVRPFFSASQYAGAPSPSSSSPARFRQGVSSPTINYRAGSSFGNGRVSSGLSSFPFLAPRVLSAPAVVPLSDIVLDGGLAVPIDAFDDDWWLPSNPGDTPEEGQETPNGPIGDALLPLLCAAVAFWLYRRRKVLRSQS